VELNHILRGLLRACQYHHSPGSGAGTATPEFFLLFLISIINREQEGKTGSVWELVLVRVWGEDIRKGVRG
jgi:hypothetical protein